MTTRLLKRSALTALTIATTVLVGLAVAENTDKALLERARGLFKALPDTAHVDDYPHSSERIELGKKLFFETRVSTDGRMSCAACHNPSYYGADSLALSVGVHGTLLPRNAPTVFNTPLLIYLIISCLINHWKGKPQCQIVWSPSSRLHHFVCDVPFSRR